MPKQIKKTKKVPKQKKIYRDNIQGLKRSQIRRLTYQAGVKSVSALVYEEVRGIVKVNMENVIRNAVIYAEHARRTTIKSSDVNESLRLLGHSVYGGDVDVKIPNVVSYERHLRKSQGGETKKKTKRYSKTTMFLRKVHYYQKQHDCFFFQSSPFKRLVKEIGQDYAQNLRFTKGSLTIIQLFVEEYLRILFEDSNLACIHAHRETLQPRDLQLTRRLRGERA